MEKLSKIRQGFGKLHLGLYLLFALMAGFGGITAGFLEKYSLIDQELFKSEWRRARGSGGAYTPAEEVKDRIFKPLKLNKKINYRLENGKWEKSVVYDDSEDVPWYYFLLLAAWLWPLYRHYFSRKPQDPGRIESRIVNLPLVIFGLCWLMALQRCLGKISAYSAQYGQAPERILGVFGVSALLFGAFSGYLNLELTGLYIRRFMARPFFLENNPYGLKRGFAASLTMRYALMIFSIAAVPLLLSLFIPAFSNMDTLAKLRDTSGAGWGWTIPYEQLRVAIPIIVTALLAGIILVFQAVSIVLYRLNVQTPVSTLVRRMKAVAAGDFSCKTSVLYADELGQLKGHFNLMLDGLVERDHIKDTFGRYVSMEIAEKIMKSGKVNLAGEEIQATVLFSDIRGFTPLSEKLPPGELIRFLNDYFTYITKPISANRGVINKFIGDAVMAIFSPVFGVEDHQAAGVRAALGMREALKEFNALGRHPEVFFGVGLHSGGLVAGNVGTAERLEYTVLGDTVNVASRIESQTKAAATQLLVSEAVLQGLDKGKFPGTSFIECAPVLMKGKSRPMVLYKVEPA